MGYSKRILFAIFCALVIIIAWVVVLNTESISDKQLNLIIQAEENMRDGIYVLAIPVLEEAISYNAVHTIRAENELKKAYLQLINQSGNRRKYLGLLDKQMNRKDAAPDVFMEAAEFHLDVSRIQDALEVLRDGIAKTRDQGLIDFYELNRYHYEINFNVYHEVSSIFGTSIAVMSDDKWGIAEVTGTLMIPCEYDKVSTFNNNRAIVLKDGKISAINRANNRLALLDQEKERVTDFGNYAGGRIPLKTKEGWKRATGDFEMGATTFDDIGTYSGGYVAAKQNGKWGVIDLGSNWLIPPEHEGIVMDELGRSYGQGIVFVRTGISVVMYVDGQATDFRFDDALPFGSEGYAAVLQNGKWGFIDNNGVIQVPHQFDDALSFGQHLAAVQYGEKWGYINLYGNLVIDAIFFNAKSFGGGSAPVLTERGWQFITLIEFKKGVSL